MNKWKFFRRHWRTGAGILVAALLAGCVGYAGPDGGAVYVNTYGPDAYVFRGNYWGRDHDFARRGFASRSVAGVHAGGGFHR